MTTQDSNHTRPILGLAEPTWPAPTRTCLDCGAVFSPRRHDATLCFDCAPSGMLTASPLVATGQGRAQARTNRDARVILMFAALCAGFALAFGVVWLCGWLRIGG